MRWLSRINRMLLYTYPREFRLEYGGEIERQFRDRCRDMAQANNPSRQFVSSFRA